MKPFKQIEDDRIAASAQHYAARDIRVTKARQAFEAEERAARDECAAKAEKLQAEHDAEVERRKRQLGEDKLAACLEVWKAHLSGTELPRAFADRARIVQASIEAHGDELVGPHSARVPHPWHAAACVALGLAAPAPERWPHFRELELEKAIRAGTPSEIVAAFEAVEKSLTKPQRVRTHAPQPEPKITEHTPKLIA